MKNGPKQMTQFKRCYCIILPSSTNCAKQIIHKGCCYIPSMEHQMVGYFAKFTSLVWQLVFVELQSPHSPILPSFTSTLPNCHFLPNCESQHYPIPSVVYLYNANLS